MKAELSDDLWLSEETRGSIRWDQHEKRILALASMPAPEAWRFIVPALIRGGYSKRAAYELRRLLWIGRRLELDARRAGERIV
jgi:hypothetical protein